MTMMKRRVMVRITTAQDDLIEPCNIVSCCVKEL